MTRTHILIVVYLLAIVIANLLVARFGASVVVFNALVLVSLDITSRDSLHDAWHGPRLRRNMALLIASGSVLSAALDMAALPVAIASFCAFALSGIADTVVYGRLEERPWWQRVNGSNVVSAFVDSVAFLSLLAALGGLPWSVVPALVIGQWAAKTLGGAAWSVVLGRWRARSVRVSEA
jgi:uncharacterized PurR-regulated membrane protein YhhQ (DUF165 family)